MPSNPQAQRRVAAKLVECGFFCSPNQIQQEVRDANRFLHVPFEGVDVSLQFFRVSLERGDHEFVVVDARSSGNHDVARAAAASRFSSAACVLLLRDGEGYATVDHHLSSEAMEIAAAVATIRYSAAWDESEVIVVSDSAGEFDVRITLEDDGLYALVRGAERRTVG